MGWFDCLRGKKVKQLPDDWCEGKSSDELMRMLNAQGEVLSLHSGNMIVCEILNRLVRAQQ